MASDGSLAALERHLNRVAPINQAFRNKIQLLQREYVPPFDEKIGWDTRFMPRKDGQAYYPIPVVWFTVEVMAALSGLRPPMLMTEPKTSSEEDRKQAADTELLLRFEFQNQNMEEVHLDLCKVLSLKGRAGVKVGYGPGDELWTENIDAIENLWPEFENDSYRRIRAYSYHSVISPDVAREEYGWNGDTNYGGFFSSVAKHFRIATAANPLGRGGSNPSSDMPAYDGVPMVDHHYRDAKGNVRNAIFIGSQVVSDEDIKMSDWPYIEVNCTKEPGNPFGIGDAEPVVGIQKEIATRKTAWAEAIRRNGQDQWKAYNMRGITHRELPGGGRVIMLGDKESQDLEPLKFPIDDLGYKAYLDDVWDDFRRVTGIPPEVLGGGNISAATSGYAMAVKFQSVVTRLGPRERRLKSFYRRWSKMTLSNMELVDPTTKAIIDGNYFTNPEFEAVTPKDFAQTVTSLATAISAGMYSRRTAIEELGKVSEDEFAYMREYNSDAALSPETAAAIQASLGQIQALLSGNPATAAGVMDAKANAMTPATPGENQHTLPAGGPPQRDTAPQMVGAGVAAGSPVSVSPPTF